MFASKTVVGHLARGVVGLGALLGGVLLTERHPWLALSLLPVALFALRGCPMCWTVGLIQTVHARLRGRSTDGLCRDGSCDKG
jgi:hypothetical protein